MRCAIAISFLALLMSSCGSETIRRNDYDVHGIDVSHYQKQINWDTVARQGIHFAFVKATEGEELKDSLFQKNWSEIQRVGIRRGAYHFFHPTLSSVHQAKNYIDQVVLLRGDLPPVLDIEVTGGLPRPVLVERVKTWLMIIERHYQIRPIIYTNLKFYTRYLSGEFSHHPIWIARYSWLKPWLVDGRDWHFWQYGDRGQLPGIQGDVDFNVFRGSLAELETLCLNRSAVLSDFSDEPDVFLPLQPVQNDFSVVDDQ